MGIKPTLLDKVLAGANRRYNEGYFAAEPARTMHALAIRRKTTNRKQPKQQPRSRHS